MDPDFQPQDDDAGRIKPGAVAAGTILLVVGGTMLLDTTGAVDVPLRRLAGPLIMIALGALMLIDKGGLVYGYRQRTADGARMRLRRRGGRTGGVWLIGLGAWMLVSQLHVLGLDFHNSWPLLIIVSGTIMLIKGLR